MSTASTIPESCPHERRPGLTVCLHCRHAAREAEAERRRRALGRALVTLGGAALGVVVFLAAMRAREETAAAASAPASAARAPLPATPASDPSSVPAPHETAPPVVTAAAIAPSTGDADAPVHLALAEPKPDPAASEPAPAVPLRPLVAVGRTELPEGMYAERRGDSVTVHFDTELGRTRRPEKFERLLRVTLPAIYGAPAEAILAATPDGSIAGSGDLLTELPARGVRLAARDGWTLLVRPETRPGRDGPLVVRYVATVER